MSIIRTISKLPLVRLLDGKKRKTSHLLLIVAAVLTVAKDVLPQTQGIEQFFAVAGMLLKAFGELDAKAKSK